MSGNFIVMFKDDTPKATIDQAADEIVSKGGVINHYYDSSILGFSATLPDGYMGVLEQHECVEAVEPDGEVRTMS
ncbi:hypothetical protein BASA50_005905 [Batrachochytrium salamandrivorans]|uniref:Inhibitor I9 domain-containing protein n=1 Tax=Batrachochytrium salamandrivorans TaxID=1357716 RepID=A0ABQ8FBJ1_9FUNG|nr:hypothetical protein BASA60_009846 [Batrachochytrium salamandrivorans]KAH6573211.1 hypothetical protein BASA62_003073 [Batrachochytrium salamandrivorans]KAH6580785.1 hypothetical protein BASA61_009420 [Batrachochytrium salamandrivorans]KAH6595387.1 hypothetical protein BASA50_005905 [Batrachochytrium salamandrivorans]KAH9247375.1 hypothetical protein BASA81_015038 [Batrachochytrium salamandrivorans]